MYVLNTEGIKKFQRLEVVHLVAYLVLIVVLVALKGVGDYFWLRNPTFTMKYGTNTYWLI